METKQAIIDALRAFLATRPGFEPGDYSDAASYRADVRMATRQRHDAERFLRDVEMRDSITAEDILREAQGGRISLGWSSVCNACWHNPKLQHKHERRMVVDYTAGQYYCTEYRGAVARLLASVLWSWKRDHAMPAAELIRANGNGPQCEVYPGGISAGDWLRASFRREYGRGIASRYFN